MTYSVVRLKTHFTLQRRLHGALDAAFAREERTTELGLDEELAVEDVRGRVEWGARDGRVNIVLSSDGVCNQEPDDLELVKSTSIEEASEDLVDSICEACQSDIYEEITVILTEGLRNKTVGRGLSCCHSGSG